VWSPPFTSAALEKAGGRMFSDVELAGSVPVARVTDFWTKEGARFVAFDRVLEPRFSYARITRLKAACPGCQIKTG